MSDSLPSGLPSAPPPAPEAEAHRLRPDIRAQIIDGEIVELTTPSAEHGNAQAGIVTHLRGLFHRRLRPEDDSLPGGWWIMTEVEIEFEPDQYYVPDVVGWRRGESATAPSGRPMTIRPDWVCEVVSPSSARDDLVKKLRVLQRCAVGHYWIVDLANETLMVLRWTPEGYVVSLTAGRSDRVRAEPFDAVELPVGVLFGDDEE